MNEEQIINDEADSKVEDARQIEEGVPQTTTMAAENEEPLLFQTNFKPETPAETIRKSGLAYSAALALVGSVVFLLIIGWILDSLFGTAPWCLVGGILIGSALGFYQFFRITSQILKDDS